MRLIGAFLLSLLLAGCATAPSVSLESPDAKVPANAGLVAVQVVSNSERLSDMLWNWTAIFLVEQRPGAEPLYLEALDSPDLGTDVFVGALPPGRYRLVVLQSFLNTGDFTYRLRAEIPGFLGTFNVETGRLTNLGTLVAQPLESVQTETGVSRRYVVTRSDKRAEFASFIRDRLPQRMGMLTSDQELGWNPDAFDAVRDAIMDKIREHGLPRDAITVGATGELLSFGRLGQVYRRSTSGEWSRHSLPGDHEIYSGTRRSDGSVALGGQGGVVYISQPPFTAFDARRLPDAAGSVFELLEAEPGTLVGFVLRRDQLRIYASGDDGLTWNQEHSLPREKPGFFFSVSFPYVLREADGTLVVLMDGKQLRRAPGQSRWVEGEGVEFTRLVRQANGIVVGVPYDAWSGEESPQLSTDGGRTWKRTAIPTRTLSPARGTPYVFEDLRFLAPGAAASFSLFGGWKQHETVALQISSDNGRTFTDHGKLPMGCDRLRGNISSDTLIFALCADGRMLSSTDGGRRFDVEFDPTITSSDIDAVLQNFLPDRTSPTTPSPP